MTRTMYQYMAITIPVEVPDVPGPDATDEEWYAYDLAMGSAGTAAYDAVINAWPGIKVHDSDFYE